MTTAWAYQKQRRAGQPIDRAAQFPRCAMTFRFMLGEDCYLEDNTVEPQVAIVVDKGNGYFLNPDDAIRLSEVLRDAAAAISN